MGLEFFFLPSLPISLSLSPPPPFSLSLHFDLPNLYLFINTIPLVNFGVCQVRC